MEYRASCQATQTENIPNYTEMYRSKTIKLNHMGAERVFDKSRY